MPKCPAQSYILLLPYILFYFSLIKVGKATVDPTKCNVEIFYGGCLVPPLWPTSHQQSVQRYREHEPNAGPDLLRHITYYKLIVSRKAFTELPHSSVTFSTRIYDIIRTNIPKCAIIQTFYLTISFNQPCMNIKVDSANHSKIVIYHSEYMRSAYAQHTAYYVTTRLCTVNRMILKRNRHNIQPIFMHFPSIYSIDVGERCWWTLWSSHGLCEMDIHLYIVYISLFPWDSSQP